jgi:hypothetical protein
VRRHREELNRRAQRDKAALKEADHHEDIRAGLRLRDLRALRGDLLCRRTRFRGLAVQREPRAETLKGEREAAEEILAKDAKKAGREKVSKLCFLWCAEQSSVVLAG